MNQKILLDLETKWDYLRTKFRISAQKNFFFNIVSIFWIKFILQEYTPFGFSYRLEFYSFKTTILKSFLMILRGHVECVEQKVLEITWKYFFQRFSK